jgi:hypothetical protein
MSETAATAATTAAATAEAAKSALPASAVTPVACACVQHAAVSWVAQIIVAVILAQTLFFKFTYAKETEFIFRDRGGRPAATAAGLAELLCVVLLLIPRTAAVGAVLSLVVISGAIMTHLTGLGIAIVDPETGESDGGLLFGLALTVAACSLVVLYLRRSELPWVGPTLARLVP